MRLARWTGAIAFAIVRAVRSARGSVLLSRIFTWWRGSTIGAAYDIGRRGALVGEDDQGNRYFEERRRSLMGRKRRWVIYCGAAEASRIPPDWYGWLHHLYDAPPNQSPLPRKAWEKPRIPNLTGTPGAYHPPGSLHRLDPVKPMDAYEAWSPQQGE